MNKKTRELWIIAMLAIAGVASGGYLAAADVAPAAGAEAPASASTATP